MALIVTGLDHHTAEVAIRERCALSDDARIALAYQLCIPPIKSVVILNTCNRLEIYADVHDVASAQTVIMRKLAADFGVPSDVLYTYTGQEAVTHLLRVTCGLESMVLGEPQILGQVSATYTQAQAAHFITPDLHRLFSIALQTGKRAHTQTGISRHTTSVSHAALTLADGAKSVLIIGAGEMAEQAAIAAVDRNITHVHIINRTYEAAQLLAERINGTAHAWSELWALMERVDCAISATGAPHTVLQTVDLAPVLAGRDTPLTLMDIALPRDVEPSAHGLDGLNLHDIDDIQRVVDANRRQREACVPDVERIIVEESALFMAWWHGREVVPTIAELRRKVQAVAQAELEAALKNLAHLDDADRQHIERLAHRLVNKILHDPTVNLRQRAQNGDADDYSRVLRELFALVSDEASHAG